MEHGDILDLKFVNGYSMLQLMATNPAPVEVGSLSHYLQVFIHPRWVFGISEPSTAGKPFTSEFHPA